MIKKVLIVDDDAEAAGVLGIKLRQRGYQPIISEGGEAAVESAKSERPDFIILDLMMPRVDGSTIATFLKEETQTRDIPIVFFTALISKDEERLESSQSNRIVSKLNDWTSIMERIERYLA